MQRLPLTLVTVLFGLGFARTGHAEPITVWIYGDGETTRMFSELAVLARDTDITPINRGVEGSGPDTSPTVGQRIYWDLTVTPRAEWPDVIHIGYNASAISYVNCWYSTWPTNLEALARSEADAIKAAADLVRDQGIEVLLSIGPGIPSVSPIYQCMTQAFGAVTARLNVIAPSYPRVDYSGRTAGVIGGTPDAKLKLLPTATARWEADLHRVHVSCDKERYFYPGTKPYKYCVEVPTELHRQKLGAWCVAKTVLKAYQTFQ